MFGNGAMFGMNGDNYSPVYIMAYNRSGAIVYKGQVCMADILLTQAETTGTAPHTGNPNGAFYNLGPITQAADTEGQPCYVLDDVSCADNALARWVKCGECEIAVCDDDVSTTDVDKGDRIAILVSQASAGGALTTGGGEVQAWVTGGARTLALALEDAAADSTVTARTVTATAHLRWCIFFGGVALLGTSDT